MHNTCIHIHNTRRRTTTFDIKYLVFIVIKYSENISAVNMSLQFNSGSIFGKNYKDNSLFRYLFFFSICTLSMRVNVQFTYNLLDLYTNVSSFLSCIIDGLFKVS